MLEWLGVPADPLWIGLIIGAAVLGGFLRGFVGFGSALALVPVLSLALGPRQAVAIASLVGLSSVAPLLPEAVRHADRKLVLPAAVAIVLGAPAGSLLLTSIDPRIMTAVIGIAVMAMSIATWVSAPPHVAAMGWVPLAAGWVSGMLQGAAGIGGPPIVAVIMARGGHAVVQRGNVLGVVTAISVSGAVSHWWFGLFSVRVAILALALLPVFLGSIWLGSRFFTTAGQRHFRAAALGVLLVIGFLTAGLALRSLAAG